MLNIYLSDVIRYFRNRQESSHLLPNFKITFRDKCIWYIINPGVPREYASSISTSLLIPLSLHICTSIAYMDRLKPICLHLTCWRNIAIVSSRKKTSLPKSSFIQSQTAQAMFWNPCLEQFCKQKRWKDANIQEFLLIRVHLSVLIPLVSLLECTFITRKRNSTKIRKW